MDDEIEAWASQPTYVEAWPRFDIRTVGRHGVKDRRLIIFRDERQHRIGHVSFEDDNDGALIVDYRFFPVRYLARGIGTIELPFTTRPAPRGEGETLATAACPICGRRVRILVFRGSWGCAKCHRLKNRSNLVGSISAIDEEREGLRASLKIGRARYERQAAFDAKRARLKELDRQRARQLKRLPSADFRYRVDAEYVDLASDVDYWMWKDIDRTDD